VRDKLLDKLIETHRVDEETAKDSVNSRIRNPCIGQGQTVDSIARNRVLMLWFKNYSWDVKMLSIS
jgi:hypothetical protein